ACGPQEHLAVAPVTSIPVIPPVLLVTQTPRPPSTVVMMTVSTPAPVPTPIMVLQAPAAPAPAPAAPAPVPAAMAAPPPAAAAVAAQPPAGGAAPPPPAGAAPRPVAAGGGAPQPAGVGPGRKKRSVDLSKMKKCWSAEFDVIMDQKNISQETPEIVENLESKVESIRKIFNNTMNRIEIKSIKLV
ncbi:hypothetical protein X798_07460, partial [Onchocerca flexuosa]